MSGELEEPSEEVVFLRHETARKSQKIAELTAEIEQLRAEIERLKKYFLKP